MAILNKFSELGESITAKSKNVVQKAKDASGIAGLNAQISALDDKLKELYEQLGRSYCEHFGTEPAAPLAAQVVEIAAALEEQATIREQIKSIRGVVCCTGCGKELPIGSGFCPDCGAKVPDPVVNTCPNCSAIVPDNAAFCSHCDTSLAK